MQSKENNKQKYHNLSLMTLGSNNHSEPTKKTIEAEELYSSEPVAHADNRVYVFKLPVDTEISHLVGALTTRFT